VAFSYLEVQGSAQPPAKKNGKSNREKDYIFVINDVVSYKVSGN